MVILTQWLTGSLTYWNYSLLFWNTYSKKKLYICTETTTETGTFIAVNP